MYVGEVYLGGRLRVFVMCVQGCIWDTYTIKKDKMQVIQVFDPKSLIFIVVAEIETQMFTKPPDVTKNARLE